MSYHIDLSTIFMDEYSQKIEKSYILPSRMVLKEKLEERFNYFIQLGIANLHDLQQFLKKKHNIEALCKNELFSIEYLKILLREINSILPKPTQFDEFIGISDETLLKLKKIGIKNTLQIYNHVLTPKDRMEFGQKTEIDSAALLELTKLADLSRIKYVGALFARVLYFAGFDTLEKVANAHDVQLYEAFCKTNQNMNLYKGKIGLHDIQLCIELAKEVPIEIEYELT